MVVRMRQKSSGQDVKARVKEILRSNNDIRIVVVGTTCTGKSTMIKQLKAEGFQVHDMDELVFPKLTSEEREAVNKTPWTPDIGKLMNRLAKKYVEIVPGEPVFGTIVFNCDLVIYLHISDRLLKERIIDRDVNFNDAKNMQIQLEENIARSGIRSIKLEV